MYTEPSDDVVINKDRKRGIRVNFLTNKVVYSYM